MKVTLSGSARHGTRWQDTCNLGKQCRGSHGQCRDGGSGRAHSERDWRGARRAVTAVSTSALQAIGMLGRRGTCCLVGLPLGEFPTPIFDVVLNALMIRGSIRRNAPRYRRSACLCRRWQGEGALRIGATAKHQQHLRPDEEGPDSRAHRDDAQLSSGPHSRLSAERGGT